MLKKTILIGALCSLLSLPAPSPGAPATRPATRDVIQPTTRDVVQPATDPAEVLTPQAVRALYDRVTPSLVAVQFTWESEMGRREIIGAGVILSPEGLVMTSMGLFDVRLPDDQLKDFKIIVPHHEREDEEIDAVFLGRDERTNLAFVKAVKTRDWTPLSFVSEKFSVGDELVSIGLLPKSEGYRTYAIRGHVASLLRGEIPHIAVDSGLATIGSPVFNARGQAVGFVSIQQGHNAYLNANSVIEALQSQPHFFVPAYDFLWSLDDLPTPGEPMKLSWMGVVQLAGVNKDVADAFGLKDKPVVEVGDVVVGGPAARAGLKPGDKIIAIDGQPIPAGDTPNDLPGIVRRIMIRRKPGSEVRLDVVRVPNQPPVKLTMQLGEQPRPATLADRFYAEDLGFSAREMVFGDTYLRRLPADAPGVVVSFIKPQGAAQSAGLKNGDVILAMNRDDVQTLEQFKARYQQLRKDHPRDPIVLVVLREGQTQTIRIETPQ